VTHPLLKSLEAAVASGRKLLVPYLMTGLPDTETFPRAFAAAQRHADVVELGLPFSDPLMDGPVIAAAGERAIRAGIGPIDAIELSGKLEGTVPRLLMTYYNPIHRTGEDDFCRMAAGAGAAGLIVPDLPVEESSSLREAAASHELAWVPLVAPTSSSERVKVITETATGFVYAVSTLGVTGTREALSERAARVVAACREATDKPVLVGIGVSNADQARAAASSADGVVIGSAVVRTILEEGPEATEKFLRSVREALDTL
jgi:tryptophan synthase alpha chain